MRRMIFVLCLLLTACDGVNPVTSVTANKDIHMDSLSDINARLAFTCVHEIIPEASPDSDDLDPPSPDSFCILS